MHLLKGALCSCGKMAFNIQVPAKKMDSDTFGFSLNRVTQR
jgi:hypothetical protein